MGCHYCKLENPNLPEEPALGTSPERHGVLKRCPRCQTLLEFIAEEWRAAHEVDLSHVEKYYPEAFRKLRGM